MTLEFMAFFWLRFEKNCPVAMFERSPRYGIGHPDVLGVTKAGYLLEIEIKRSVADFKANAKKYHQRTRYEGCFDKSEADFYAKKRPKQYWFLVPPGLVDKIRPIVPEWAGLLRGPTEEEIQHIFSVKPAPTNEQSQRITGKEKIKLARNMSNQILSHIKQIDALRTRLQMKESPVWPPEYHI